MSIDAMRQALAALEDAVSALRSEMAWRSEMGFRACIDAAEPWAKAAESLRAAIEQAQEPFCYHDGRNIVGKEFADHSDVFPLYTAPRQWQGLTEAEKVNVALECGCADVAWMDFADAIEAKLRERNA